MPPEFRLPMDYRVERPTELWVPAAIDATQDLAWGNRSFHLVGRLRPEATLGQASAEVGRVTAEWSRLGHVGSASDGFDRAAVPLDDLVLGEVRPALMILFGAVGLVLLIACANVAHLLLARSDARRREIATRAALGASRRRIARQLFAESALLGGLGAVAGVALGYVGLRAVLALTPVHVIHARAGLSLDWTVLGFAALLAVASTVLAGLAPALQLSRVDVATAMGSVRSQGASSQRGVRRTLVAVETALAVVLVIGAIVLLLLLRLINRARAG
jgi:hypothetical protein